MVMTESQRVARRSRREKGTGGRFLGQVPSVPPHSPENTNTPRYARYRAVKLPKRLVPRWETPDPPGIHGSYGPLVVDWAAKELGLVFGPWQAYVADRILRFDRHGDLIHREALFSTGRQNGKSVIVRGFYGWLLDIGRTIGPFREWTDIRAAAHDAKQARIIYKGVYQDLEQIPRLTKKPERTTHDAYEPPPVRLSRQIGIETDSLFFDILTSEPGSTRGLSIGALAFDEVLTQRDFDMWGAVSPTQAAQRSPLLMLTSSAGLADSVVLRQYYDDLRRQATGDQKPDPSFYGVWWESEDEEVGYSGGTRTGHLTPADWDEIGKANPALGDGRLTKAAIEREFHVFPKTTWQRERLNHFIDLAADAAFNAGVWAKNRCPNPMANVGGPYAMGVDIQPGWERATICVAGIREDSRIAVEVYKDLRGTDDEPVTADRIIRAVRGFPDIDSVLAIAYDQQSPGATAFLHDQENTGLPWDPLKPGRVMLACMGVEETIRAAGLAVDDPLLDAQLPTVARRPVGQDGAFRFSRRDSTGPIDAFMAMTFAADAVKYYGSGPLIG